MKSAMAASPRPTPNGAVAGAGLRADARSRLGPEQDSQFVRQSHMVHDDVVVAGLLDRIVDVGGGQAETLPEELPELLIADDVVRRRNVGCVVGLEAQLIRPGF